MLNLCFHCTVKQRLIIISQSVVFSSYFGVHLLTYWSFLIGEKRGVVATVHVGHTYVVTVSPVQLPEEG